MSTVANDKACIEFSQHAWRPEVCVNCQRPRNEHTSVTKPANAPAADTSSQSGNQNSQVITSSETTASIPVPNKRVSTVPRQSKTAAVLIAESQHKSKAVHASESQNKTEEYSAQTQRKQVVKGRDWKKSKSQLGRETEDKQSQSDQGSNIRKNQSEGNGELDPKQAKQGIKLAKSRLEQSKSYSVDKVEISQSRGSLLRKSHSEDSERKDLPKGILSCNGRKKSLEKSYSHVVFTDTSPYIIGYDGGLVNLFDDDGDDSGQHVSSSEDSFSLTDEEKSFALLSLENTVWNSDAGNLLKGKTSAPRSLRHSSHEFEDLNLDSLCFTRHFQNLKDCDATERFGTFPLRKRSNSTKQGLDAIFSGTTQTFPELESLRLSSLDVNKGSEGSSSTDNCRSSSQPDLDLRSSNGDIKDGPAMTDSSTPAYKVVNIVDDSNRDSYTITDITTCLYDTSHSKPQDSDSVSENSGNSSGKGQASSSESNSPAHVKVRGRSRPAAIRVSAIERRASPRCDSSAEKDDADFDSLSDSSGAAGLQVLALLNDVLSNYGENESSTDDPSDPRTGDFTDQDKVAGKKSSEFEARMASVAASLDLSKQRAKRPAPRPPSSPPPEPTVSPKKKTQNQPEPVFKMVPVGKAILTVPASQDIPKSYCSSPQGQGLPSFDDLTEGEVERLNGDSGRAKKGFTSFFKNILRRGKDSSEIFESSNPEVQFAVKSDISPSSTLVILSDDSIDTMNRKRSDSASAQSKIRVLPSGGTAGVKSGSSSTGDLPSLGRKKSVDSEDSCDAMSQSGQGKMPSPPTQPKSKGLSSPKQMLKRTTAKLSPPTQHKSLSQTKEEVTASTAKSKSNSSQKTPEDKEGNETASQPTPVRRRTKSPKRIPPPAPPARFTGGAKSEESLTTDLTRELEQRLRSSGASASITATTAPAVPLKPTGQPAASKSASQTLKPDFQSAATRSEIRKSMTVPPPSPPTNKLGQASRSPPASPTPEEADSQPGSPDDDTANSDDSPRFTEKIELPTAAPGKKGILGKLNMNRKSRAPAPPASVKRARSISDAEKRGKRINPADISGPMLVIDAVLENRRNTISLVDDSGAPASSAVAQSIEKGFDDLDMPILSPLGSLENLYEAILPKEGAAGRFPYYDPPDKGTRSLCPNVPAVGYLEPVAPGTSSTAAEASRDQAETISSVESSPAKSIGEGKETKTDALVQKSATPTKVLSSASTGEGETFVEPELTDERRQLIASQPIYEEIPSHIADSWEDRNSDDVFDNKSLTSQITLLTDISNTSPAHVQSATLPHPKRKPSTESAPRIARRGSSSHTDTSAIFVTSAQAMTSSMASALPVTSTLASSPFMTASMTSSLLWPNTPAQPVDSNGELLPLPPIPQMAPRSVSKETVSSESDTHSSGGTLSRPRPIPRRRPKRPDTTGSDQYVSMNRPNTQVTLGEAKLRETFSRLTALNFQTLHDVYVQCERLLALDRFALTTSSHLKWADFDIYGQALHASGRCVVYNAKLRANNTACQLMVLHSRPAAEMSLSTHPSLLRPAAIFADNVPFSFLTPEFIKTSQLLQNSLYDSCQARCFLAVGLFDIADSLANHLTLLRETLIHDPAGYLHVLLMTTLQLLSAMSHCLDRGFTVTETDLGDVFHIARHDLRGKVVAFLPHQRAPDVPQGEAMCGFLDKLLQEATNDYYNHDTGEDPAADPEESQMLTTVERLRILLEPRRIECLAHIRAVVEYTLWGPRKLGDTFITSASSADNSESLESVGESDTSSVEQDHSAWLERERAAMVARFATGVDGLANGVALDDFYRLKFLLKSSATSLAECWRRLN